MTVSGSASPAIDKRIDWNGTLAALEAAFGVAAGTPVGCWAYTTDFGFVVWNGSSWAMQNSNTIVAATTVTQAAGTPVASELVNVTLTAAGAITLPASIPGMIITVHNLSGSFALSVFPNAGGTTTEAINGGSANAAKSLPLNTSCQFTCTVAGAWWTMPRTPS